MVLILAPLEITQAICEEHWWENEVYIFLDTYAATRVVPLEIVTDFTEATFKEVCRSLHIW